MNRMRRILFASDFSSASRPAFAKALYMARAFHSELILIHAVEMTAPVVSAAIAIAGPKWPCLRRGFERGGAKNRRSAHPTRTPLACRQRVVAHSVKVFRHIFQDARNLLSLNCVV